MEKKNTWNVRCLVDESFVPLNKQTSVLYFRLSDFYMPTVVFQTSHSRTCMSACAALATTTMLLMMQSCQKYVHTVQRYSRQIQFCNWRPILIGKNTDVSSLSSRRSESSTYVHSVHNTYAIMQCMYELVHSSLLYSVVALYERLVRRLARRKSTRGRSNAPWFKAA